MVVHAFLEQPSAPRFFFQIPEMNMVVITGGAVKDLVMGIPEVLPAVVLNQVYTVCTLNFDTDFIWTTHKSLNKTNVYFNSNFAFTGILSFSAGI
jgi:hypothetical protein